MRCSSLAMLLASVAYTGSVAAAPQWHISDGSLTFVAIQQGAAFEGSFERFSVDFRFAPDELETSYLLVTVDLGSVDTRYGERDELLRAPEFFNVMQWPRGRFEARSFRSLGGNVFEASGELTLRDQSHPLVVPFEFRDDGASARLTGEVVVSRLRFGIGQGEWADTTWIGGDVTVKFDLSLIAQAAAQSVP